MARMFIVLDTNVIQEDFLIQSGRADIVLNYAHRTESTFLLPRIVHEEIAGNYERESHARFAALVRDREQLNGRSLSPDRKRLELDFTDAINGYLIHLKTTLGVKDADILDSASGRVHQARYVQRASTVLTARVWKVAR